jgi:hypothetical protein
MGIPNALQGSWTGKNLLWDRPGQPPRESEGAMTVTEDEVRYTWSFEGKAHEGVVSVGPDGAVWSDSWHQAKKTALRSIEGHPAPVALTYGYSAPPGPDWHWRILLAQRPDGSVVLQMVNITCWGEEAEAVRLVGTAG